MPVVKKKPKQVQKSGDDQLAAAFRRAEEAEALVAELRSKLRRRDDEDEDDDDDEDEPAGRSKSQLLAYDPRTHIALSVEDHHLLLANKAETDRGALAHIGAMRQQMETQFTGWSKGAEIDEKRRERDLALIDQQRELISTFQSKVYEKDMELSRLVRQSEDAKLERERLAADVHRMETANAQLQMTLSSQERMKQMELDALRKAAEPAFGTVAALLRNVMSQYFPAGGAPGSAPGMGGAPAAGLPAGAPAGGAQARGTFRVSEAGTDEFRAALFETLGTLGPGALARLRALLCSGLLPPFGVQAPPVSQELLTDLVTHVQSDAGSHIVALLHLCEAAYVVEGRPSAASQPN